MVAQKIANFDPCNNVNKTRFYTPTTYYGYGNCHGITIKSSRLSNAWSNVSRLLCACRTAD